MSAAIQPTLFHHTITIHHLYSQWCSRNGTGVSHQRWTMQQHPFHQDWLEQGWTEKDRASRHTKTPHHSMSGSRRHPADRSTQKPTTTITTVLRPFFRDHPGEPVPEENFWTLWCKGRLTEADTPTIRLGATPSGLSSAHLHHPPIFLQAGCPSCHPTNSVKALKATSTFGFGRRR